MNKDTMCHVPVKATYKVIDGEPVMVDAQWEEIPAKLIARFLLQRFGLDMGERLKLRSVPEERLETRKGVET